MICRWGAVWILKNYLPSFILLFNYKSLKNKCSFLKIHLHSLKPKQNFLFTWKTLLRCIGVCKKHIWGESLNILKSKQKGNARYKLLVFYLGSGCKLSLQTIILTPSENSVSNKLHLDKVSTLNNSAFLLAWLYSLRYSILIPKMDNNFADYPIANLYLHEC